MNKKIYKCEDCEDRFFKYKMDLLDAWYFDHIIQPEGEYTKCKGYVYKLLYEHYRKKVSDVKELVGDW